MSDASSISDRLRFCWRMQEASASEAGAPPLFAGLAPPEIESVLQAGATFHARSGETIVKEGDGGDDLFLILAGVVAVRRRVNDEPRDLLILNKGQIFGELAFMASLPRTADVAALEDTDILKLSRSAFLNFAEAAPATAFSLILNVALSLCQRLATSTDVATNVISRSERLKAQQESDRRRTLSQMVAGVAHEINTPLGIANHAASIVTELARDLATTSGAGKTADDIMAACRLLQDNVARADRLVQTFKTLSVSQAVDQLEKVGLVQLTRDTADLYRLKARSSKLDVSVRSSLGGQDDAWEGYPGHYAQILLNLLTNVDRYAYLEDVGGKVDIDIASRGSAGFLVTLRDFGRGVAEADLERIFEPFYTTGRGKGGTGLGLSIVKNLVEESLCGRISARAPAGGGLEMRLELPRVVVASAQ